MVLITLLQQGSSAGQYSGGNSVHIGRLAGRYMGGIHNVSIGYHAGAYNTNSPGAAGGYNVFVGSLAGTSQTSGSSNVGVGNESLEALTEGSANVAIGSQAGHSLNTGGSNTLLGLSAGSGITSGTGNTLIGRSANQSAADITDEIVLKAGTDALAGGGTETIRIGVDSDYIVNDFGENATWTHSSDRRIKKDIKDTNLGLEFILKLQPKEFKKKAPSEYPKEFEQYNAETTERKNPDKTHYGFVAQEVKEAMDLVGHSEFPVWSKQDDGMEMLGETEFITPLVKAVQELSEENKQLKDKLKDLEIFIMDKLGDDK